MDFSKINILIERNRALTEMSSLPFVIKENGMKRIAWFNYTVEPSHEGMSGRVRRAFLTDANLNVRELDVSVSVEIPVFECNEPEYDEDGYIDELSRDYETMDHKTNMNCIKKAVLENFVPLYEAVYAKLFREE